MSVHSDRSEAMDRIRDERLRKALAEIKRALVERIGPDFRLILFGSRARGDAEHAGFMVFGAVEREGLPL